MNLSKCLFAKRESFEVEICFQEDVLLCKLCLNMCFKMISII